MQVFRPQRFPPTLRVLVGAAALVSMLLPGGASAFCIYNQTSSTVNARVTQGDFSSDIGANGNACCNWSNTSCNPSGSQDALLTAQIELFSFNCTVSMQAGGYALVQQEDRSGMGLPPNYYCNSYDRNNQLVSTANTYGLGATTRDVRFLATADPQYNNDGGNNPLANQTLGTMVNQLRGSAQVRGLLIAGDLTQNTRPNDEFSWYKSAISGYSRFVYDGLGNHDVMEATSTQSSACDFGMNSCVDPERLRSDITNRKRATLKTYGSGPHYSWDWQDVHFVQLNLFPGNGTVPEQYFQGSPQNSLSFLQSDLALFVGKSGRPVVLIHHYGFDGFSTGAESPYEVWWTGAQRGAYWDVISAYNVVGIFAGHNHMEAMSSNWKVPFQRPAGRSTGPESIPSFVSGAALNGAYLDAQIDQDVFRVTRRDSQGTAQPGDAVYAVRGNLAFRKPTSQSSTYDTGYASRAVDGRTEGSYSSGSVSHTQLNTVQPWWQVDLQSVQQVKDVILYNRTDSCCAHRLRDFNLLVSDDGSAWQSFAYPGTVGTEVSFAVNRSARYVKVQLNGTGTLSLAEVQVFAPVNLAFGRPAQQSSTFDLAEASRAVDGRTQGEYYGAYNSVTHTQWDSQPWWQVDLQSVQQVGDVVLSNRTDCCADRLHDFSVLVSEDGATWQTFGYPGTAGTRVSFPVNRAARYVKVQLNGAGILSLAEVQVFKRP